MLRYADVLLMFAEAENELNGPTGAAQDAMRRVRQRAFAPAHWPDKVDAYVAAISGGKESFFDAIVDERAWEFGGEMIRKYELIRWGIYGEKMTETVQGLKALADGAFNGSSELPDYFFWKRDASGRFILLNPNRKIPLAQHTALTDAGWTRTEFLLNLHDNTLTYKEWILKDWANYMKGEVRYIFPIPTAEVSQGVLKNDGYGFGG
jgi:hypothetical protein